MTEDETNAGHQKRLRPGRHRARRIVLVVLVVGVFGMGLFLRPVFELYYERALKLPHLWSGTPVKPGPWGVLSTIPIMIGAPEELLPVREFEARRPHWFFQGMTRDVFAKLVDRLGLPPGQRAQLLDPATLHESADGVEVEPPAEVVLNLTPQARLEVYRQLASSDRGAAELVFVSTVQLEQRFQQNRVAQETVALFKQLSCPHGHYLIFSGMSHLLATIPTYEGKAHFLHALTQQQTFLVYLRVTAQSDISTLARYWGKSSYATDVKPLLESLAAGSGRVQLDIIELLPPLPTSLLYTYPIPQNPMKGPVIRQDCYWTAFNFFRDTPDSRYNDMNYIAEKLREDYFPVQSDPRYGDVVAFADPDRSIIHTAVFIADNIVYTKNGYSVLYPWIFSTVSDLVDLYSFKLPPGQTVQANYFRNKY